MIHQPLPDGCETVTRCVACNARHGEEHRPRCVQRPSELRARMRDALRVEHGLEGAGRALLALVTGDGVPRRWWDELQDQGVTRADLEDAVVDALRAAAVVDEDPPIPVDGRRVRALLELEHAQEDAARAVAALRALEGAA